MIYEISCINYFDFEHRCPIYIFLDGELKSVLYLVELFMYDEAVSPVAFSTNSLNAKGVKVMFGVWFSRLNSKSMNFSVWVLLASVIL